jgi:nucleoid DNA-binding protein
VRKKGLAREIARSSGIAPGDAADQLDKAVAQIVNALKKGQTTRLPGIGVLRPGKGTSGQSGWTFRAERAPEAQK